MHVTQYPSCCTAIIFKDLPNAHGIPDEATADIKKELKRLLKEYANLSHIVCITIEKQENAESALAECGFISGVRSRGAKVWVYSSNKEEENEE